MNAEDFQVMKLGIEVPVGNSGLWFAAAYPTSVLIEEAIINYVDDEAEFGELILHFDPNRWCVEKHGLVYTDDLFLETMQHELKKRGIDVTNMTYSEQGMQGEDYISCDIGASVLRTWPRVAEVCADEA